MPRNELLRLYLCRSRPAASGADSLYVPPRPCRRRELLAGHQNNSPRPAPLAAHSAAGTERFRARRVYPAPTPPPRKRKLHVKLIHYKYGWQIAARAIPARGNVRAFAVTSAATPRRSLKGQLYLRSNTERRNLKLKRKNCIQETKLILLATVPIH